MQSAMLAELKAAQAGLLSQLDGWLHERLPTMDRRSFLRRSGLGVGVGIAASQLTLVKKSNAAEGPPVLSHQSTMRWRWRSWWWRY